MTAQQGAVASFLVELELALDEPHAAQLAPQVIAAVAAPGEAQDNVAELLDARGLLLARHPDTQALAARIVERVYDTQDPTP